MPRTARIIIPNMPHHIVQRGHDRKAVFLECRDYEYYLNNLTEWKQKLEIKLYSFCLMTNHIHLIVEPGDDASTISQLMKRLAAKQTRWANRLERRSGTLWESRYKCSPIDSDGYLLHCCRYVELNPVKARMVEHPEQYKWSSYSFRLEDDECWLDDNPAYLALSPVKRRRQERYRKFVEEENESVTTLIREAVARNQLTGSSGFIDEIERRIGKRIETRGRGRPNCSGK